MCVRCQLGFRATDVLCPSVPPFRFPFGFSAFHGPHSRLKGYAIHTENGAAFAAPRYKSACKGTAFCQNGNKFCLFFECFLSFFYLCNKINLFMFCKINLLVLFLACMCLPAHAQTHRRLTNLPHVYIETENHAAITSKESSEKVKKSAFYEVFLQIFLSVEKKCVILQPELEYARINNKNKTIRQ